MVVQHAHNFEKQILLVLENSKWAESLRQRFSKLGYIASISYDVKDVDVEIVAKKMAAVIVRSEGIVLLESLRKQPTPPLLVLIAENKLQRDIDKNTWSLVDAVIVPDPIHIVKQVQSLLDLRRENSQLKQRILELEEVIYKQKRVTSEIEVLKNAIVRNVSHELRTPLLQVKSAVALISDEVADKKLVEYAENATARLETHVKNITMLGHSLEINLGPIILHDTIEYARRNLGRGWQVGGDSERIRVELEDHLPPVLADKQGLSTILQLLLDNALKFSDKDVFVKAHLRGEEVYIEVRDEGIGIKEDQVPDVFESFLQLDNSTTRRYGGTGVGLAIVQLILDLHNTEIRVDSALGRGSTFWFTLPRIDLSAR